MHMPGTRSSSLLLLFTVVLWCASAAHAQTACVDYRPDGYYDTIGTYPNLVWTHVDSLPNSTFTRLPSTISVCELQQLHVDCVVLLNKYRSGELKFTGGTSDSAIPVPALTARTGSHKCSSEAAMGDMVDNYDSGSADSCTGAGNNKIACVGDSTGNGTYWAHNSCCLRTGTTYDSVYSQMASCLQSMWDEGLGTSSVTAHWKHIRDSKYTHVSCGFAFTSTGKVWMTQDFTYGAKVPCSPVCNACGTDDGCGGTCFCDSGETTTPTPTKISSTTASRTVITRPTSTASATGPHDAKKKDSGSHALTYVAVCVGGVLLLAGLAGLLMLVRRRSQSEAAYTASEHMGNM